MIGTFVGNMETSRESCYVFDGVYQIWFVVKNILSLISMFLFHISYIHHHGQAMITLCYIGALGIQKMGRMGEEEMNKSSFVCMFMWRLYRKFEKKC